MGCERPAELCSCSRCCAFRGRVFESSGWKYPLGGKGLVLWGLRFCLFVLRVFLLLLFIVKATPLQLGLRAKGTVPSPRGEMLRGAPRLRSWELPVRAPGAGGMLFHLPSPFQGGISGVLKEG